MAHPTNWSWRKRGMGRTCDWCGSVTPETFVERCRERPETVSGSDWKYGWPHKFYLHDPHGKFYSAHLEGWDGLTPEVSDLIAEVTGVRFEREAESGRVVWRAPHGIQRFTDPVTGERMVGFGP